MKLKEDEPYPQTFIFESTGREAYANCGIIGLGPELEVFEGYDGDFDCFVKPGESSALTKEERIELADYMIGLWQQFKQEKNDDDDD